MRLTVAQATVRFLAAQWSERDGTEQRLVAGCLGIFGHGNVAGLGEALLSAGDALRYYQGRNEQAMVHIAAGYARARHRLSTLACTTSIGPGATNLVTGAALATVNRLPVLLLPGDAFATRVANPVLQELEDPRTYDVSVNDTLAPVSRYWDRIHRPEQLPAALLQAMRVLTDPAETGAVTLALPQDVQAQAYDWPPWLFARRVWHVPRPVPEPAALARAAAVIRAARAPLLVAGGGVVYSGATAALRELVEATGIPVAETQAGKGSLPYDHPQSVGAVGVTGSTAANGLARRADVVIGVGTRYSDFTTASRSLFPPAARFVNLNVTGFDAHKLGAMGPGASPPAVDPGAGEVPPAADQGAVATGGPAPSADGGVALVADARSGLVALAGALAGWSVPDDHRVEAARLAAAWDETVTAAYARGHQPLPAQSEVIGAVNDAAGAHGVVVCAAGSMPGDLHKLWRAREPAGYHVEYGYSCMGYEIPGGIGVKLAEPDREVFVLVGDGSYLMMPGELVTAVAERVKLVVVLVDNAGYASIGALSESVGSGGFGTRYRYRDPETGRLDGPELPVDLAANAASLGARVLRAGTVAALREALADAVAAAETTVIHVRTDPEVPAPDSGAWWDVPVAAVSALPATRAARAAYDQARRRPIPPS